MTVCEDTMTTWEGTVAIWKDSMTILEDTSSQPQLGKPKASLLWAVRNRRQKVKILSKFSGTWRSWWIETCLPRIRLIKHHRQAAACPRPTR